MGQPAQKMLGVGESRNMMQGGTRSLSAPAAGNLQTWCQYCHLDEGFLPPEQPGFRVLLTPLDSSDEGKGHDLSWGGTSPGLGLGDARADPQAHPCLPRGLERSLLPRKPAHFLFPRLSSMRDRTRTLKCAGCCSLTRSCAGKRGNVRMYLVVDKTVHLAKM